MTEQQWLASTNPQSMLRFITVDGSLPGDGPNRKTIASDRKLRLFACACCRSVWHLFTDARSRRAVEVAERYADGLATQRERHDARAEAVFSNLPSLAQSTCYRNETIVRGLLDELDHEHGL